jgi:hypothetical protein
MWLNHGTIDGDDSVLPFMLSYITFYHKERISKSTKENKRKAFKIRVGIELGTSALFVLLILFLLQWCLNSSFH